MNRTIDSHDDAEGHMVGPIEENEDTKVDEAGEADTEGHRARPQASVSPAGEDDDTGGHLHRLV